MTPALPSGRAASRSSRCSTRPRTIPSAVSPDVAARADWIVVSSRRFSATLPRLPRRDAACAYYLALADGSLGFVPAALLERPPGIPPLVLPTRLGEETLSVFDHPRVRIYRNNAYLTRPKMRERIDAEDTEACGHLAIGADILDMRRAMSTGLRPHPRWMFAAALAVVATVIGIRLYRLDGLQTEVYGDIDIVHAYMDSILAGHWPYWFVLSSGPLYHYIIAPLVLLGGNTYETLKLASVAMSLGALAATWAMAKRLASPITPEHPHAFALAALLIAGTGSWLLIFSRLGNSQIEVPFVTMLALLFLTRAVQDDRIADYAAAGAIGALGLYGYPQSFILPGVLVVVLAALRLAGWRIPLPRVAVFLLATVVVALPFIAIFAAQSDAFLGGYIGQKLQADAGVLPALAMNVVHAIGAFAWTGDSVARSNPIGVPHVDPLTLLLMLAGVACWLSTAERRRHAPLLLIPFVLLQVPSVLVLAQPQEVPSASRTLAVAPIAALLAASGLWWMLRPLARRHRAQASAPRPRSCSWWRR